MYNENFEYIISHFKNGDEPYLGTIHVNGNHINKSILRPLLRALTDEDAEKLRNMCGNDSGLKYRIDNRKVILKSDDKTFERNESVDTLFDWLKTRKGWVSVIKRELKRRFDYMDWKDQVRVMRLFLFTAKTDREWCYKRMRRWWNDEVKEDLMACWEKYHDELAAEVVARYAPMDFVMQNESELARLSPTDLCLRTGRLDYMAEDLSSDQKFYSYVYVLSKLKPFLSYDEQKVLLYKAVAFDLLSYTYDLFSSQNDKYQFHGNLTSFLISAFGKMACPDIIVEYEMWRNDCLEAAASVIALKDWPSEGRAFLCKNAIRFKTFVTSLPIVSDNIRILYDVLSEKVTIEDFEAKSKEFIGREQYQLMILRKLHIIDLIIKDSENIDVWAKLSELHIFPFEFIVMSDKLNGFDDLRFPF